MEQNDKKSEILKHWRAWGSWYSWGSPVGIGIGWFLFMTGAGLGLYLIKMAESLS
jgi:hypothetical protein